MSDTITLYVPEVNRWTSVSKDLNWRFNVNHLNKYASIFKNSIKDCTIIEKMQDNSKSDFHFIKTYLQKKNTNKKELTEFVSFFLAEPRNIHHFIEALPEYVKILNEKVLTQGYVSIEELEKEYPDVIWATIGNDRWVYDKTIKAAIDYPWLITEKIYQYKWGYHKDQSLQSLCHYTYGGILSPYFLPALHHDINILPQGIKDLPSSQKLTIFNAEEQMLTAVPIIQSLKSQGELKCDATLKLKVAEIRKVQNICNLQHFHPASLPKEAALANSITLSLPLIAFFCNYNSGTLKSNYPLIAKGIVDKMGGWFQPTAFLKYFAPYLTGLTKRHNDMNPKYQLITRLLIAIKSYNDNWIDFMELYKSIAIHHLGFGYYDTTICMEEFNQTSIENKMSANKLIPSHFVSEITIPILKSIVCALAGLGLMEIAYRPYDTKKGETTPFDFICYARLTNLGKYAFGIERTYEIPKRKGVKYFEIDEEHLIIRSLQENNPYEQILKQTAAPIGNKRYRMSPESFLSNCSSKADVDKSIEHFHSFISAKPPKIWEEFFVEIKNRINPLSSEASNNYQIYKISPTNKGLLQLLATDPELRSLVIRAEGLRILVPINDLGKFKKRLKAFGYLL